MQELNKLLERVYDDEDFIIHTLVGYGSKHDGERILLRFCCDCFDKIVDECKISPIAEGK